MKAIAQLGLQEPSPPLKLPARFGRYRLTRLLAVGGMAQIYLAKAFGAEGFVKPLVIKRLDPRLADNPHFTSLFVNEAKLLVTLNHGNIVSVFDFGRIGDDLYMAMEHIHGVSLRKVLQALYETDQLLDAQLAAYIATEICKGLDYAHRKTDERSGNPAGIIHRDIKPTNILVSFEGEVKIVDFGVAKLAGRMDQRGMLAGTLAYMSPEQAERLAVDPRTDIFSTGLVLYELVTRKRAYWADRPLDVLDMARKAKLPQMPESVPKELQEIIRRATRPHAPDRYSTAHEMEQALSEYLLLARSAGATMDALSPASKLSTLLKSLPLEVEAIDDDDEDLQDLQDDDDSELGMVSGVIELQDPPDLAMISNAAETFHSEFLTRVLEEEQEPPRRPWIWLALGAGMAAAVATVLVLLFQGSGSDPGHTPVARDLGKAAAHPAPDQTLAVVALDVGPSTAPADGAVASKGQDGGPIQHIRVSVSWVDASRPGPSKKDAGVRIRKRPRIRHGFLNLNSIPWSNVTIDGRRIGRPTPLLRLRLRLGWHTIVLENRERRLHKKIKVRIRPGVTTKLVRLK